MYGGKMYTTVYLFNNIRPFMKLANLSYKKVHEFVGGWEMTAVESGVYGGEDFNEWNDDNIIYDMLRESCDTYGKIYDEYWLIDKAKTGCTTIRKSVINKVDIGDDVDDLFELTGVDSENLWQLGFNLDDITSLLRCEKPITSTVIGKMLEEQMADYCVGYCYKKYNGYHYYTLHHA